MNDVRVIGLMMHTVLIEDIMLDVPHGITVTIPAEKAARSKDLWRLLGQKQLFRLNSGPFADYPQPTHSNGEVDRLKEENRLLSEQNQLLRQAMTSQGGKLDAILGLLESGRLVAAAPQNGASVASAKVDPALVEIEVPTYIPSEIKPQNVESHIEVKSETTAGTGVAGAGEALRRLRKGAR